MRVLSYNILVGGNRRVEPLTSVLQSAHADLIGLVEATNPRVVETLAKRLEMHHSMSGRGRWARDWHLAVLSRLPIIQTRVHTRPEVFTRHHLLEVSVEQPDGTPLTAFIFHQTASFQHRSSIGIRRAEIQEILAIMSEHQGRPHLFMGDFNSLAPGDSVQPSVLLRYLLREQAIQKKLSLSWSKPRPGTLAAYRRHAIRATVRTLLRSRMARALIDKISPAYAQGGIDLLLAAGYTDCFRQLHPDDLGYTCPAVVPAGRIDFIFASPELAQRLLACQVLTKDDGVPVDEASDHLPVYADFTTP